MNDDTISRKAAIDAIVNLTVQGGREEIRKRAKESSIGWIGGIDDAIRAIEELPSAQPECEKCKWFSEEFPYKIGEQIATGFDVCFWNRIYPMRVDRDFFCAHFQEDEE